MALQAMWVHGAAAMAAWPGGDGLEWSAHRRLMKVKEPSGETLPWTDQLGFRLPVRGGATFRGHENDGNVFSFAIPTPEVLTSSLMRPTSPCARRPCN